MVPNLTITIHTIGRGGRNLSLSAPRRSPDQHLDLLAGADDALHDAVRGRVAHPDPLVLYPVRQREPGHADREHAEPDDQRDGLRAPHEERLLERAWREHRARRHRASQPAAHSLARVLEVAADETRDVALLEREVVRAELVPRRQRP